MRTEGVINLTQCELWIRQIREVTFDAEDAIDDYMLHLEQRRTMKDWLRKMFHSWNTVRSTRGIAKQIQQINTRLQKISECRERYRIDVSFERAQDSEVVAGTAWRQQGVARFTYGDLVGFQNQFDKLVNLLKDTDQQLKIICIIGMGGLGKTTLALNIYLNHDFSPSFDVSLWITVSQMYQLKDLLLNLLQKVGGTGMCVPGEEDSQSLKAKVQKELSNKKYLLIIDDIWNVEAWEQISDAFTDNSKGSRIILTTRMKEVALRANPSNDTHIKLHPLNTEESFELFCRKVFSQPIAGCPPELVDLGKEIVRQCHGLPLAIVVISGLLMGKERKPDAWSKVLKRVNWYLSQDTNHCYQILMLSYSDLPSCLKSCFLYLGFYPEYLDIDVKVMIRLLVAEGFVQARGHVTAEEVAEECVNELVQRSLIEVKSRVYHEGPIDYLRVHDLLRDIAIAEGRKDNFMVIHTNKYYSSTSNISARRLAIHPGTIYEDGYFPNTVPNLRTLLFFVKVMPAFSTNHNKVLRVLDLKGVYATLPKHIPKEIGELILLHYLGLSKITKLPSSTRNLLKLQTLDIQHVLDFTKSIWELNSLRHLLFYSDGIIEGVVSEDFGKNLLTLSVKGGKSLDKTGLLDVLVKHECLQALTLRGELVLNNDDKSLRTRFPLSLTELSLRGSLIDEDPSDVLGSLPSLKILSLDYESVTTSEMTFAKGSFPQLQYLYLASLRNLVDWKVEDGSLHHLVHLKMHRLDRLEKLPDGLRNAANLQRMDIIVMPQMKDRIKENGQDRDIIKHISLLQYYSQYQPILDDLENGNCR